MVIIIYFCTSKIFVYLDMTLYWTVRKLIFCNFAKGVQLQPPTFEPQQNWLWTFNINKLWYWSGFKRSILLIEMFFLQFLFFSTSNIRVQSWNPNWPKKVDCGFQCQLLPIANNAYRHRKVGSSHYNESTLKTSYHSKPTEQAQTMQRLITGSNIRVKSWNPNWPKKVDCWVQCQFLPNARTLPSIEKALIQVFCAPNLSFRL